MKYLIYLGIVSSVFLLFPQLLGMILVVLLISSLLYLFFLRPIKNKLTIKWEHNKFSFNLFLLVFCVALMFLTISVSYI